MPTELQDDRGPAKGGAPLPWWQRLEQIKVTPLVVLCFLLLLAAFATAAAGIASLSHHLASALQHPRH